MLKRLLPLLLLSGIATPALAQRGTIAVFPFGANSRDPQERETARQIQARFEQQLQESKRFMAVLPRSTEVDNALTQEYEKSMDPASLDALVRISQSSRLTSNFVVDGYLEQHELRQQRDDKGRDVWSAKARMRIRIVNVETGALFLSDMMTVDNSTVSEAARYVQKKSNAGDAKNDSEGGWIGRAREKLQQKADEVLSESIAGGLLVDRDPTSAINRMRKNADDVAKNFLAQRLGYFLRDYEVDDAGNPSALVVRAGTDLRPGATLEVREQVASRLNPGEVRTNKLGTIRIDRVEDGDAIASLVEGKEKIGAVLKKKNPSITINTPER